MKKLERDVKLNKKKKIKNKGNIVLQCKVSLKNKGNIAVTCVVSNHGKLMTWPRGYKTFFMLTSAETKIYPADKC